MSSKPSLCILHLDARSLDAWRRDGADFRCQARFAADETGHAAFLEYLEASRHCVFYLLVDLAEEDFVRAELPPVRGSDRRALLQRKLEQLFPDSRFLLASSLGRNSDGRKDEKFLFSALTRPHVIDPWLDAMAAKAVSLGGAYSSSQFTGRFADMRQAGCRILVTLGKSGLRQSCHLDGRLIFSRLAATPATPATSLAENAATITAEAEKIRQYLIGQRLIARDERIHIACLASATEWPTLESQLALDSTFLCEHILLSGRSGDDIQASDAAFIGMLADRPPVGQYLPAALRQNHRVRQARTALRRISLVTLFASLALMAALLLAANRYQADFARTYEAGKDARQRYQAMLATLPDTGETPESLRALALASAPLMQQDLLMNGTLADISTVLTGVPQISLRSLNWKLSANADGTDANDKPLAYVITDLGIQYLDEEQLPGFVERLAALPDTHASMPARPGGAAGNGSADVRLIRHLRP